MDPPDLAASRDDLEAFDILPSPPTTASPSITPGHTSDGLWTAALDATGLAAPGILSIAWDDLVRGWIRICGEGKGEQRTYVLATLSIAEPEQDDGLELPEATLLGRLLCGEPQKALAAEFLLAPSTVSSHLVRALVKLGLSGHAVALPIVLSAQAWQMGSRIEDARSAPFAYQGRLHRVLSVPRPATARLPGLTPAQQEIAGLLIDGFSRAEIAEQRGASVNTVTGQISSIFSALRVSGRYALIRAAVDVGCFDCTRVPRRYAGGMRGEKR